MQELPPGLADVMQHVDCDNDLGDVGLGDFEAGGEGASVSLQAAEGILHLCVGLALAPVELCLVGVQLAILGLHEPGEEWIGGVPSEEGWDHH